MTDMMHRRRKIDYKGFVQGMDFRQKVSKFAGALHGPHLRLVMESRSQQERGKEIGSFLGVRRGDASVVRTCGAMALFSLSLAAKMFKANLQIYYPQWRESGPDKTKRLDLIKPIVVHNVFKSSDADVPTLKLIR